MCAKLLACPLCSQPSFPTLDALKAGLINVATRPLVCPVCNELLLGIDKLTIHLFSHSIDLNISTTESSNVTNVGTHSTNQTHGAEDTIFHDWNILKTQLRGAEHTKRNELYQIRLSSNDKAYSNCGNYGKLILKTDENVREGITDATDSKCSTQYYYADDMKDSKAQNVTETIKTNNFNEIWVENITIDEHMTKNMTKKTMGLRESEKNCPLPKDLELNKKSLTEGAAVINNKEDDPSHFQSFPNVASLSPSPHLNNEQNLQESGDCNTNMDCRVQHSDAVNNLPCIKTKKIINGNEKTEHCNICGLHFADNNILLLHKELVHTINKGDDNVVNNEILKNYSCNLCSKVFKMRGSLMVHMRVAHTVYNSAIEFVDGETTATQNNGYSCPTCGKKFRREQHVMQHLKTHEGKQWECDVCSKLFTTKYFLKKHKRLHSGEMPYKCNICNKTFTFQQSYHKHRLYHKDDKPHTCATCGRSFKELSTLHNHERIHTGEKPFACETCGKCFRQRVSYLVHRRIHTGVMPYKCTMCGKSFRYKVSQRTHKCPMQMVENITQPLMNSAQSIARASTVQNRDSESDRTRDNINGEEKKFVLIINTDGQHVLTRESDIINTQFSIKEGAMETKQCLDTNDNGSHRAWTSQQPNEGLKNIIESSNETHRNCKNMCRESENELFSMVLTPLEDKLCPTLEINETTVSSVEEQNTFIDTYNSFDASQEAREANIINTNLGENFVCNSNGANTTLQTINEESLKQLLYGIDKK